MKTGQGIMHRVSQIFRGSALDDERQFSQERADGKPARHRDYSWHRQTSSDAFISKIGDGRLVLRDQDAILLGSPGENLKIRRAFPRLPRERYRPAGANAFVAGGRRQVEGVRR
jgi:hypothetical protein